MKNKLIAKQIREIYGKDLHDDQVDLIWKKIIMMVKLIYR